MLVPMTISIYFREVGFQSFLISAAIAIGLGVLIKKGFSTSKEPTVKESFIIVTLGWITAAAVGALPFLLSGTCPTYTDAFFEAMSGFTTTGATVLGDIEALSKGLLFWRSLLHWLGGMGIIVLFIAVLPGVGVGGGRLFRAEVPGPVPEKIVPRIKRDCKDSLADIRWIHCNGDNLALSGRDEPFRFSEPCLCHNGYRGHLH